MVLFLFSNTYSQKKPFPQANNFSGSIKPNHVNQTTLNQQVGSYYNYWKGKYLKNDLSTLPGAYYVLGDITGEAEGFKPLGSSEGIGYGMIISALMAGFDTSAQTIFNGLYLTAKTYRSNGNFNLMGWVVADDVKAQGHFGSATDGDMDIAYALILADQQWGSAGKINYLAAAKKLINDGLQLSYVTADGRMNLGDWQTFFSTDTRPSDWMPEHYRAYQKVTGDTIWNKVINSTYQLVKDLQNNYSPKTGLLPDIATGKPVKPAAPNFLEGPNDGHYYYNAARIPLRLAMDYGHYETTDAKIALNKILSWIKVQSNSQPYGIKAGYTLDGADLPQNNYQSAIFIAPIVAACTIDPAHQTYLNLGWSSITSMKEGYFEDSYNLLCQLYISGNWWKP